MKGYKTMTVKKTSGSRGIKVKKSEWIDISYALSHDMVYWPKDPIPPHIDWIFSPEKDRPVMMLQMNINPHHGTHVDAPHHFFPESNISIDKMPLDAIMGPARVIEIKDKISIKPAELKSHNIKPGERILFKTVNSTYWKKGKFVYEYVYISNEAADFLVQKKVSVVGLDYIAVGTFTNLENLIHVHNTLLGNGIWIVEQIDLSAVKPGNYEIICLPIKIKDGDGAQARAILRPLD
jgi:arylformamidase